MHRTSHSGFTLVEMIVAVALFAIVMLVCVGALLALVGANRKVHALQSVMNNLNVALDGMVRNIRMGSNYDGTTGGGCTGGTNGKDCTGGSTQFSFEPYGGIVGGINPGDQPWVYKYDPDGSVCAQAKSICRSVNGGAFQAITSQDITINSVSFYVVGSARGCTGTPCDPQPKVVMVIKGTAPVLNSQAKTTFHIQVTAVQRLLDL